MRFSFGLLQQVTQISMNCFMLTSNVLFSTILFFVVEFLFVLIYLSCLNYTFVGNYSIVKALFYVMVSLIVNMFIYTALWINILLNNICCLFNILYKQEYIYIYIYQMD